MSKVKKLFLDVEDEDEIVNLGLLRLSQEALPHELFYKINLLNAFQFNRTKDLVVTGKFYRNHFPRFEAYHHLTKNCIQIISNKSTQTYQIIEQEELFNSESESGYLFSDLLEVDYIIKTSDLIDDFSLILWPENSVFKIQKYPVSSLDERYQLIHYYE